MNTSFFFSSFQDVFEINTNIFETNVINLIIVLLVLFRFLGSAIDSLLQERKQIIVANLEQSNRKVRLVKENLLHVQSKLNVTQEKMTTVYTERFSLFLNKKQVFLSQVEKYLTQLQTSRVDIVQSQTQKVLTQIYNQVISLTFEKFLMIIVSSFKDSNNSSLKTRTTSNFISRFRFSKG
jgi:F-type H+-transporting ATPase subunit b